MAVSNRERVGRALELLTAGLRRFIEQEMHGAYGNRWVDVANEAFDPGYVRPRGKWDTAGLLRIMQAQWDPVFRRTLGKTERNLVFELRDTRNKWAHEEPFSPDDAYRALDSVERLLQAVSAPEAADATRQKQELLRSTFEQQARKAVREATLTPTEGQPAAGFQPWRQVVTPHPDVASGRYQQAEFAADLGQVHRGEGSEEYRDPREFFRRTYVTEGLRHLLVRALERLSDKGGDPVVELQTNFGGGKTHSLLALYHLFSSASSADLPGVEPLLQGAEVEAAPEAQRAVLVGTAISPGQPQRKADGTEVRTLWGELAWQLGGREAFDLIAESDATATNPGEALNELLYLYSPCLILIDEWVAYARQLYGKDELPAGTFDTHFTFAQALTEAVRATPKTLLVISIPASEPISPEPGDEGRPSEVEIGGEGGKAALERLRNVIGRIQSPWRPASAEESFEIVRRRLFQPLEGESFAARDAVIKGFSDLYRQQSQEFPQGVGEKAYERRLEAAYPVHPELFDRLYEDWSTLEKFQRTRGVLRLLAAVIHSLWERQDGSLLILPGTVPIDDSRVQSELTKYLEDHWRPIIDQDIDGPNSLPLELDRENPALGKYSATRRVARTVYLGSAPTLRTAHRGLEDRNIKLGCVQPGEAPAVFGDALRRLSDRATFLYVDGRRYWYSVQPTVARLAQDRATQFEVGEIWDEVVERLRKQQADRGDFVRMHVAPGGPGDVPDDPEARLVILGPEYPHTARSAESPARRLVGTVLEQRGAGPRRFRNALVFLAPDKARLDELEQATRTWMAYRSIVDERETLNLSPFDARQAESKLLEADRTIEQRIPETYSWLLVPNQQKDSELSWDELRVSGQDRLAPRASRKLVNEEGLITQLGAVRLRNDLDKIPLWRGDSAALKQLWDDYAQYMYLSRLRDARVLLGAVEGGLAMTSWSTDSFGYAEGYDQETKRFQGLRAGEQVALSMEQGLLVKPDVAAEQLAQERPEPVPGPGPGEDFEPPGKPGPEEEQAVGPRRFHGTIAVDPERLQRDAGQIAAEVVQHLSKLPGQVEITLEIQAEFPEGVPDDVARTVTENAKTLKFDQFGFEED